MKPRTLSRRSFVVLATVLMIVLMILGNASDLVLGFGGVAIGIVLILLCAGLYDIPRFSLRTLLIATTVVAVLLGLAVWAGG